MFHSSVGPQRTELAQKMEVLIFDENKNWDNYVPSLLGICEEPAILDEEVSEKEKAVKLIRHLTQSTYVLAVVSSITH